MPLNYEALMKHRFAPVRHSYGTRDTILYALGLGIGRDQPEAPENLRYTYENQLVAFPTFPVVLAGDSRWIMNPDFRVTYAMGLHGEEALQIFKPFPVVGTVIGQEKIETIVDKGDKGALLYLARHISDEATGDLLAIKRFGFFARADGNFDGPREDGPTPYPTPTDRTPSKIWQFTTSHNQALIYRLSGDYNPLHCDPDMARKAGFERPILHGLCSYGIAARAIVETVCEGQSSRLAEFNLRFASPVYPGETIEISVWDNGGGDHAFVARVVERNRVVLSNGYALVKLAG